jgi:hypothetical protein
MIRGDSAGWSWVDTIEHAPGLLGQTPLMAATWQSIPVPEVTPGDRIRFRGTEFEVGRIDSPFLGMDQMVCFIEDTPTRWHAYPGGKAESVEALRD